jgi:hypothetical protein
LVISEFGIDNSPCGGSPNFGGWHKYCAWWASKYGIGNTQDDCAAFYVDQISWSYAAQRFSCVLIIFALEFCTVLSAHHDYGSPEQVRPHDPGR